MIIAPWMSTVVLYCWCHSDSASVLLYFTLKWQYGYIKITAVFFLKIDFIFNKIKIISFVSADLSCDARKESENYKMKKFFPTVGLEPNTSRLLDWCSKQLCYGTGMNNLIINNWLIRIVVLWTDILNDRYSSRCTKRYGIKELLR